jgi:hypothetical protein
LYASCGLGKNLGGERERKREEGRKEEEEEGRRKKEEGGRRKEEEGGGRRKEGIHTLATYFSLSVSCSMALFMLCGWLKRRKEGEEWGEQEKKGRMEGARREVGRRRREEGGRRGYTRWPHIFRYR